MAVPLTVPLTAGVPSQTASAASNNFAPDGGAAPPPSAPQMLEQEVQQRLIAEELAASKLEVAAARGVTAEAKAAEAAAVADRDALKRELKSTKKKLTEATKKLRPLEKTIGKLERALARVRACNDANLIAKRDLNTKLATAKAALAKEKAARIELDDESSKILIKLLREEMENVPDGQKHLRPLIKDQVKCLKNKSGYCHWSPEVLDLCGRLVTISNSVSGQRARGRPCLLPSPRTHTPACPRICIRACPRALALLLTDGKQESPLSSAPLRLCTQAYETLRNFGALALPHPKHLKKLTGVTGGTSGHDTARYERVAADLDAHGLSVRQREAVVLFDEINIVGSIAFKIVNGKYEVYGIVDPKPDARVFGDSPATEDDPDAEVSAFVKDKIATHALVFQITLLDDTSHLEDEPAIFRRIVGIHAVNNAVAEDVDRHLWDTLYNLQKICHVRTCAVVCDGAAPNRLVQQPRTQCAQPSDQPSPIPTPSTPALVAS